MTDLALPGHWRRATLRTLCTLNPAKPGRDELPDETEVSFVPMADVDAHLVAIVGTQVRRAGEVRRGYRAFRDGDVLMAKITPSMENGKAAVADGLVNGHGFGSSEFHVVRPGSDLLSRYLLHFLHRADVRDAAAAVMEGSAGQKRVPPWFLERLEIPLPPVAEQREIAQHLDGLTVEAAQTRQGVARARAALRQFRAAVYDAALNGYLSRDQRAGRGIASWEALPAAEACALVQNGKTPREGFVDAPGIPFLKVYNLVDGAVDFTRSQFVPAESHESTLARSRVVPGDVLMNIVGPPLGKVAVVPGDHPEWNINQAITVFRPSRRVTSAWLYIVLSSGRHVAEIEPETRGSAGQVNISLTQCRAFVLPVPPVAEQEVIAERVRVLMERAAAIEHSLATVEGAFEPLLAATAQKAFHWPSSFVEIGSDFGPHEKARVKAGGARRRRAVRTRVSGSVAARVASAVAALPGHGVSFAELRELAGVPYEALREELFRLLDADEPVLVQVFDDHRRSMVFRPAQS